MPDQFLHGHIAFRRAYFEQRDALVRLAVEGQRPVALLVGCADSRVVPELLTSAAPGELFVVRNVANHIPPRDHADASVGAAIEYAIGPLGVRHVIVCGHSGCGGVKAALAGVTELPQEMTELRAWLEGVERTVAPARTDGLVGEALVTRAVEENVLGSLGNLLTYPAVRERLEDGTLQLHGWRYDLHTLALAVYDADRDAFVDVQPAR